MTHIYMLILGVHLFVIINIRFHVGVLCFVTFNIWISAHICIMSWIYWSNHRKLTSCTHVSVIVTHDCFYILLSTHANHMTKIDILSNTFPMMFKHPVPPPQHWFCTCFHTLKFTLS